MKTAEFGQPCVALPEAGRCRICGCTETHCCSVDGADNSYCEWADNTYTLCTAPACIAEAKREIGVN